MPEEQIDLDGKLIELERVLSALVECKHNALDSVTGDRKITLYGSLAGANKIGSFNLNLNGVNDEKYQDLCKSLGIDGLRNSTPLLLTVSVPHGALLNDWETRNEDGGGGDGE